MIAQVRNSIILIHRNKNPNQNIEVLRTPFKTMVVTIDDLLRDLIASLVLLDSYNTVQCSTQSTTDSSDSVRLFLGMPLAPI